MCPEMKTNAIRRKIRLPSISLTFVNDSRSYNFIAEESKEGISYIMI